MADNLRTHVVVCQGGLVRNIDPLTQASQMPGSATRMINYEPSLRGGYRRINGFANNFGTVPGTGKTLGVYVDGNINDGIFACRKSVDDDEYFYRWDNTAEDWVVISTPASVTMDGVKRVRFSRHNWSTQVIMLVDGVNPAAKYDGTTYTQITDSNAPSKPKLVQEFSSHLFLAGDSDEPYNLYFSAPLDETDFDPANGAGVINVGFDVVQIKSFRDQLYIFGKQQIKRLRGNSIADFVLSDVTTDIGCLAPDTVVEFSGDIIFLGPDGVRPISGTERIGDVEISTVSRQIQSVFDSYTIAEDLEQLQTVVIRRKSQLRMFFENSESLSLIGAVRVSGGGQQVFEYSQLIGVEATCTASGYIGQNEFVIHGDSEGKVHQQEVGYSFGGQDIISVYQTPNFYMEDPEVRKYFHEVKTYFLAEGETTVSFGAFYDYEDLGTAQPDTYTYTTEGAAAFYGTSSYDVGDIYDGNPSPVRKTYISGSGTSVSFSYVSVDTNPSHTIQAITVTYGLADRR